MLLGIFVFCLGVHVASVTGQNLNPDHFVSEDEVNIIQPTRSFEGNRLLKLMVNQPVETNAEYYFSCRLRLLSIPANLMWVRANLVVVMIPRHGSPKWIEFGRIGKLQPADGWVDIGGDFLTEQGTAKVNMQVSITDQGSVPLEISSMRMAKIRKNPKWKEEANSRIDFLRKGRISLSFTNPKEYPTEQIHFKLEQIASSFPVGSAIQGGRMNPNSRGNRKYQEFFTENFNCGVPENDVKWRMMERREGSVSFRNGDLALAALKSRNYVSRAHCLFWGRSKKIPSWLKNESPAAVKDALERRMDYIAEHYGNSFDHWDLNNEQLHERWFDEKLQDPNLLSWMFKEFHARVPNSKLFLNDFQVFGSGVSAQAYKHQAKKLLNDSAPVHGIGIQAHFGKKTSPEVLAKRLAVISEAGLPIWLTEFDVVLDDEEEQLELMEDVLRLAFSHPQVEGIVFWGFWDRAMWRRKSALASGSEFELTAAGMLFRNLFFDEWRTNEEFTVATTSDFTWATNAFHGKYKLSARLDDEVLWTKEFELGQCGNIFLEVEI